MYACKNKNGQITLIQDLPSDAVEYFEFNRTELSKPEKDNSNYRLVVDFTNKSFSLVEIIEPEKTFSTEELIQQDITDLQLANIEQEQEITDLQISALEVQQQ